MLFLFWRVPPPSLNGEGDAPHTPQPCFSFFNVYRHPLSTAKWPLRTRHNLAFSFLACTATLSQRRRGRSAHATTLLFFFGVYRRSLATAKGPFRTRQSTHFLKTFPISLSTAFVFIGLSSDSKVYIILSP